MCGIAGIVEPSGIRRPERLKVSIDTLRHRGPDGDGIWHSPDGRVAFAHRRLAVIDLSTEASQPMADKESGVCITFNGEIYNYKDLRRTLQREGWRFHSSSDTEVLLAAYLKWGEDCLRHLNGMFAFAVFDPRDRAVVLARDRAGEKPLYYYSDDHGLIFASEIKAILAAVPELCRKIDQRSLNWYLLSGYIPDDGTMLAGIRKLPAAHVLTFNLDDRTPILSRYWALPDDPIQRGGWNISDLDEQLDTVLAGAVSRQMVSDVPIGVLLSGGLDSSLITAYASRIAPRLKTFTVRFPGFGRFDETEHARLVAKHFSTEHTELDAPAVSPAVLPGLAAQFDEPVADSSVIPTFLVTALVRQQCTVALGGDGGDELFGGYKHYSRTLLMRNYCAPIPAVVRSVLSKAVGKFVRPGGGGSNIRTWLMATNADFETSVPRVAVLFDRRLRNKILSIPSIPVEADWLQRVPQSADMLQRSTRMDFENYLPADILAKVDRASMLNSLEVRAPFLDVDVIEFAFSRVPASLKASANSRKILLKRLAARLLPSGFDASRKQGFSIPLARWLREPTWGSFVRNIIEECDGGIWNRSELRRLAEHHARGGDHSERLFSVVMFELWRRHYGVSL